MGREKRGRGKKKRKEKKKIERGGSKDPSIDRMKRNLSKTGGEEVVRGRFPCFSNAFYALNDRVIHKLLGEFLDICFRPFALENGRDGEEEEERKTRRYFSAVSNERSPTTRI